MDYWSIGVMEKIIMVFCQFDKYRQRIAFPEF